MPNEANYLVSLAATRKRKKTADNPFGADIVVLDDRRPREAWQRLDQVLARLGLLDRSTEIPVEIIPHPARGRGPNQ